MQQLIKDMKAIPGVIGACTYRSKDGITYNNLPSLFREDRLHQTAKHLAKIHAAGRLNFPELIETLVHYDESIVVFRQIDLDEHLITICDPGINMSLLSMSLNLAIENIPHKKAPTETQIKAQGTDKAAPDIQKLMNKGPMAQPLQAMLKLLTKIIGPMAKIIFEDSVARWVESSENNRGSLSKLLEIICQEIGDNEKSEEYRALVRQKMTSKNRKQKDS